MGQNNDNTEHGDLQGNQGGNLSKDPKEHGRLRQPEEGFARVPDQDALRSTRTTQPGESRKAGRAVRAP